MHVGGQYYSLLLCVLSLTIFNLRSCVVGNSSVSLNYTIQCIFIITCMCLGKYFPTLEVDAISETIEDHPQGNNY